MGAISSKGTIPAPPLSALQTMHVRAAEAGMELGSRQREPPCPLDLGRREADAVTLLQHLVGGGGLAIDADEEIGGLAARQLLGEQVCDGGAFRDVDVVGEAGAVVVD